MPWILFIQQYGDCPFNNKKRNRTIHALILDFYLHLGDGTVNILKNAGYVGIFNPSESDAGKYLLHVGKNLPDDTDIIGISAGFDNHSEDWGASLDR